MRGSWRPRLPSTSVVCCFEPVTLRMHREERKLQPGLLTKSCGERCVDQGERAGPDLQHRLDVTELCAWRHGGSCRTLQRKRIVQ